MKDKRINSKTNLRVIWKDKVENFSQERKKRLKKYYTKLYGTENVRIDFVATNQVKLGLANLDDRDIENIYSPHVQDKLMLEWLAENAPEVNLESIKNLNVKVESNIVDKVEVKSTKYKLKKLIIYNFLSYGDETIIEFDQLTGLTAISGENQVGKTTMIKEALEFVLFNQTEKAKTAEGVINIYRNLDTASVKAILDIDGFEHGIERTVNRKWKKDGTTGTVATSLDFYKVEADGNIKSLNGEQRQETDKEIRKLIGEPSDFLMTILCTASNIDNIIELKPSERGEMFIKYLGLTIFSQKEEIAKTLFKDWKAKSKTLNYNIDDLKTEIEKHKVDSETNIQSIQNLTNDLNVNNTKLGTLVKEKDELIGYLFTDIDESITRFNESHYVGNIESFKGNEVTKNQELLAITAQILPNDVEFDENALKTLIDDKNNLNSKLYSIEQDGKRLKKLIEDLKKGENCPTCGQSLKDVDHSDEIARTEAAVKEKGNEYRQTKAQVDLLIPQIENLEKLKSEYNENERNKLKKDKIELEIEAIQNKILMEEEKLAKYRSYTERVEKNKQINEKIRLKKIDIQEVETYALRINREIATHEATVKTLEQSVLTKEKLIVDIKKEQDITAIFNTYILMMGKNGISKTIIKNTVPAINIALDKLLMDVCDFSVSVDINLKNNEMEFWMYDLDTGLKKLLTTGSGFEKTVAAISLKVISNVINNLPQPDFIVFDEVFGRVSNENLEHMKNFMLRTKQYFDKIFLVTHNPLIKEWVDNEVYVKKVNNISVISY